MPRYVIPSKAVTRTPPKYTAPAPKSYTTSYNRPAPKPATAPKPTPKVTTPPRVNTTTLSGIAKASAPPPKKPNTTTGSSSYRYVPSYANETSRKAAEQYNVTKAVKDLNSPQQSVRDAAAKVLQGPTMTTKPVTPPKKSTPTKKPPATSPEVSPPGIVEEKEITFDPPITATPDTSSSSPEPTSPADPPIKSAPIDTVLFNDDLVSPEIIADLLFENIGGQEILTIARHDTVNGQPVAYQPIKNLSGISQEYSSESLVKIKSTARDIFANFPIRLQSKIPNVGNGPDGSNVYLDADGNIVIEFINLEEGQEVEVQITSSGTIESIGE